MVKSATTCGPLYKLGLDAYAGRDPEKIRLFAAGFVSGEAEKVYLGACEAAMFRPSAEWHDPLLMIVRDVAKRYGLFVVLYEDELWVCRSTASARLVEALSDAVRHSPAWHRLRARLCGVPCREVDEQFHLRRGAGERCD